MEEGKKPEYPKKTLTTSFRKYYILKPENTSSNSNSNPHSGIGCRLADVLTFTPRVTPILCHGISVPQHLSKGRRDRERHVYIYKCM